VVLSRQVNFFLVIVSRQVNSNFLAANSSKLFRFPWRLLTAKELWFHLALQLS